MKKGTFFKDVSVDVTRTITIYTNDKHLSFREERFPNDDTLTAMHPPGYVYRMSTDYLVDNETDRFNQNSSIGKVFFDRFSYYVKPEAQKISNSTRTIYLTFSFVVVLCLFQVH